MVKALTWPFASALALVEAGQQPSFDEWAAAQGMNGVDDSMRAKYEANVRIIDALNTRDSSATYAVNKFSGMSHEEFAKIYLTLKTSPVASAGLRELQLTSRNTLQDVDWDVTPVKDQAQCGSCWTFGVMGAIEGMNKVITGTEVILSEEQLVDCDRDEINDGCNGGLTDYAFKYLTGKDLYTLDSYPYTAGQSGQAGSCYTGTPSGVTITGYFAVPGAGSGSQGDDALAQALLNGPVTVTVAADDQFANYHTGVMSGVPTACDLNHAILATGYGPGWWKIKNSWGASWGADGFAVFERTTDGCGPFGIFFQDAGFQPQMGGAPGPTPPSPSPPSPGPSWYKTITPASNNFLCLDLPGDEGSNGNRLWLWECNGSESQRWVFDNYQIRFGADESKCIDAGEMWNGLQLFLWDCNGSPQQSWGFDYEASRIYLTDTSTCLDLYGDQQWNGQPLHVWECSGDWNQEWYVWNAGESTKAAISV